MRLGLFQMQILKCKTMPLLGETAHVMVAPLKAGAVQPAGAHPLPLDLHVLHAYTRLKMGSNKVSVIVHNMLDSPIFLKKGVQVVRVVSLASTLSQTLARDRSHSGSRGTARAHLSGCTSGETPTREAQPGWSQQLDSPEHCS